MLLREPAEVPERDHVAAEPRDGGHGGGASVAREERKLAEVAPRADAGHLFAVDAHSEFVYRLSQARPVVAPTEFVIERSSEPLSRVSTLAVGKARRDCSSRALFSAVGPWTRCRCTTTGARRLSAGESKRTLSLGLHLTCSCRSQQAHSEEDKPREQRQARGAD